MKNKLLVLLVAIITGFGIVRAESIDLLDSTVTVNESSVFGHSKTLYEYNNKGSLIRQTRIYATWSKWTVGVPMILNRKSVFVYDDEGHEIDLYYSTLDTATGKWADDHRYLYDEWHNRIYGVGKWNADSTALLAGTRYLFDTNHFCIGYESFDTWNGVEVIDYKYFYTNDANGYRISMYGQFRPDSAYDGDYKSYPDKFNQSGWKNVDSMYYERNAAGQSTRETVFRWDESNNQWLKDGYQNFTYDAQGHLLTDTVFARDFETNIITYNNMTVREYDSYGNLTRTTTYSPVVSEGETQWQVNDVSVNEYTYNEKGLISLKRSHTDYNDGAEPNYSTTTYYYSHYDLDENGNIVPEPCLIASGTCGDNLTWELSCDSVLTIEGTGAMNNWNWDTPWYNYRQGIKDVILPEGLTSIGDYAFCLCSNLISVVIPDGVKTIGERAFNSCENLTSIRIPNSVTSIGNYAFSQCWSIGSLSVPNSVKSIGTNAFGYIHNVVYSGTASGSPWNAQCINGYIEGFLVFQNSYKTTVCSCLPNAIGEIVIPQGVTYIKSGAFRRCTGITTVSIPEGITCIEALTFAGCTGLTSMSIPQGVTKLTDRAFSSCTSLANIILPNSLTYIDEDVFYQCSGLLTVTIPANVSHIGKRCFNYCSGLTSITCECITPPVLNEEDFSYFYEVDHFIPLYVPAESIDLYKAADQWKDFTNILPIPGTEEPFYPVVIHLYDSIRVSEIDWAITEEVNPDTSFFGEYNYTSHYYEYLVDAHGADNKWNFVAHSTPRYKVNGWLAPDFVASDSLLLTVHDTTDITLIVSSRRYPIHLKTNNYEQGLIGTSTYQTHFDTTFYSLYADSARIEAFPKKGYRFDHWSDGNTENPRYLFITQDVDITAYFEAESPSCPFTGTCGAQGDYLTWELSCDRVLTISGTGEMADYTWNTTPWKDYSIDSLVIEEGVTRIGNNAFDAYGIKSVILPNSVLSIGDCAFLSCYNLADITVGEQLQKIGKNAFYKVNSSQVHWNAIACTDVPSSGIFAYMATGVSNIIFGDKVRVIPNNFMRRAGENITELIIPENVEEIGDSAFCSCSEKLLAIYNYADSPQAINSPVFDGVNKTSCSLYVPGPSLDLYRAADGWKEFTNILPIPGTEVPCTTLEYAYQMETCVGNYTSWRNFKHLNTDVPGTYRYIDTVSAIGGCDTIFHLTLVVHPSYNYVTQDTISIVRGEPVIISKGLPWQRIEYPEETTVYGDTMQTVYYCDSIVSHYVIVKEPGFPVIFLDYNSNVLSEQRVENGKAAQAPEVPAREGYTFVGWNVDIEHIVARTFAIALYDKIGGTLTYLSEEGDVIATENVDLHLPAAPIIAGKSFKGWLTESADSENGIVLRATYTFDNPTTHDDVTITPSSNSAYVIFPFITGALTYQLVIRDLFGNVVCKIMFSATGHLLGIAFAPSRNRESQQATQTTGFNFTVEGLDANTTYEYEFVANDDTDEVIETLSGSFTTTAEVPTDNEQVNSPSAVRKYLEDGHLMIDANSHIFNTQGKMIK